MMMPSLCCLFLHSFYLFLSYAGRPNILLLFPDQWRFDWADQYEITNLSISTPAFEYIVNNGVRFSRTTVASPLCAPSRACIATGKEYDKTNVPSNNYDLPENETTIYQLMRDAGYWVMVSGKDDLVKKSGVGINGTYRATQLGFNDQARANGKYQIFQSYPNPNDPYGQYLSNITYNAAKNETRFNEIYACMYDNNYCCYSISGQSSNGYEDHECPQWLDFPTNMYEDNWVNQNTLKLFERRPNKQQPWFLQVNYPGPHPPFVILQDMNKSVENRKYPYPIASTYNYQDMEITRRDYAAEIENIDKLMSEVLQYLEHNELLNNTVICVSSDHGEMLGDYNAWNKQVPWVGSSNVPLVCMGPGIQKNVTITTPVTNMDIAGTFLDISESVVKVEYNMTTQSLRKFLNGTWTDKNNGYRSYVLSGYGHWRSVVQKVNETTIFKFLCCWKQCPDRPNLPLYGNFTKVLFDLVSDQYEEHNIGPLYPNVMNRMQQYLPPGLCL